MPKSAARLPAAKKTPVLKVVFRFQRAKFGKCGVGLNLNPPPIRNSLSQYMPIALPLVTNFSIMISSDSLIHVSESR